MLEDAERERAREAAIAAAAVPISAHMQQLQQDAVVAGRSELEAAQTWINASDWAMGGKSARITYDVILYLEEVEPTLTSGVARAERILFKLIQRMEKTRGVKNLSLIHI